MAEKAGTCQPLVYRFRTTYYCCCSTGWCGIHGRRVETAYVRRLDGWERGWVTCRFSHSRCGDLLIWLVLSALTGEHDRTAGCAVCEPKVHGAPTEKRIVGVPSRNPSIPQQTPHNGKILP